MTTNEELIHLKYRSVIRLLLHDLATVHNDDDQTLKLAFDLADQHLKWVTPPELKPLSESL